MSTTTPGAPSSEKVHVHDSSLEFSPEDHSTSDPQLDHTHRTPHPEGPGEPGQYLINFGKFMAIMMALAIVVPTGILAWVCRGDIISWWNQTSSFLGF